MGYTLITGACGGLGKAFCRELIKTDDLFLTGRSAERLNELKAELRFVNPQANVIERKRTRKSLFVRGRKRHNFFGLFRGCGRGYSEGVYEVYARKNRLSDKA